MDLKAHTKSQTSQLEAARSFQRQEFLAKDGQTVVLRFTRVRRARRFIIRTVGTNAIRVTLPWRGSLHEARLFAASNWEWIIRSLARHSTEVPSAGWTSGSEVLFRGEPSVLRRDPHSGLWLGSQHIPGVTEVKDLRPAVEHFLWGLASRELPVRTAELSAIAGISYRRVSVRNQRSRWGSCSHKGTISLNWRLVQCPDSVRDYVILHELVHRVHMNHSEAFWRKLCSLCPKYLDARAWLKANRGWFHPSSR